MEETKEIIDVEYEELLPDRPRDINTITTEILLRSCFNDRSRTSVSSTFTLPPVTSYRRCNRYTIELFPAPVAPMIPTVFPGITVKFTSFKIS